jgi:putative transposase
MANTFTCLYYHLIFSTKNREPWIRHDVESRVWSYMGGIACDNRMTPIQIGGMPDHVHAVVALPTTLSLSEAVKQLKGGSSKWVKDAVPGLKGFTWQDGYAGFTVSKSSLSEVVTYVKNQREHHRVKTFQEEYVAFLERHEIEYDPKYLWD